MSDIFDFSGRSALVTGAASPLGIGAAFARMLDRGGIARLILIDTDEAGLAALDLSCEFEHVIGSVADPALWQSLDLTGLDHAVVNAGIGGSGRIDEIDFAEWRRVMDVNLDGAFLTLRSALAAMRASGGGSAVVVSSVTGVKPVAGIGPYGVAKAGVAHMARIAAAEGAAHNIRVNAIAPGGVDTAIWESDAQFRKAMAAHGREAVIGQMAADTPRGRFATPDEIARDIGYLLSDLSANVTGTVLTSDGGYSL